MQSDSPNMFTHVFVGNLFQFRFWEFLSILKEYYNIKVSTITPIT